MLRRGDAAAKRARARPLSRRIARTRRRIVDQRHADAHHAGARGARRPLRATPPPARRDEPYRRAIAGIYSRLAKTARDLDHDVALRHPTGDAPAYATAEDFAADLDDDRAFAEEERRRASSRAGACGRCSRAVDVFGFHLAPLDLRQNSDVHERTVAELFAAAEPGVDYLKLDEDARIALLRKELARRARCSRRSIAYSEETAGELARFPRRRARSRRPTARPRSSPRSSPRRRASPTCWSWRCC